MGTEINSRFMDLCLTTDLFLVLKRNVGSVWVRAVSDSMTWVFPEPTPLKSLAKARHEPSTKAGGDGEEGRVQRGEALAILLVRKRGAQTKGGALS